MPSSGEGQGGGRALPAPTRRPGTSSYPGPRRRWPRRRIVAWGRRLPNVTELRGGACVYWLGYDWLACGHATYAGEPDRRTASCPRCYVGEPVVLGPAGNLDG